MNSFWSNLHFHVPNFILAALMYTTMGRLALSAFVPEDWDNYIYRSFVRLTDPVVKIVRAITPLVLTKPVVLIFTILWLLALRFAFTVFMLNLGLLNVGAVPSAG
ncbi:MAG: YggT family protein [Phyllobacteriaceae bacterium]|nr:YggT family protein [Phyllobacteriaceae bacterium]